MALKHRHGLRNLIRLQAAEMRFMRGIENLTRRDRIRTDITRDGLRVIPLEETLKRKRLLRLVRVMRMEDRMPKKALQNKEKGRRPRTSWMDQAQKDIGTKGENWRHLAKGEVWRDGQKWKSTSPDDPQRLKRRMMMIMKLQIPKYKRVAEDPLEVLKIQEQEKEAKKKTKLSEKENKGKTESKGKPLQASRKGIKDTQNVKTLESGKPKEAVELNTTSTLANYATEAETVVKSKPLARTVQERTDKSVKFAGSESREDFNNKRNREDRQPTIQRKDGSRGNGRFEIKEMAQDRILEIVVVVAEVPLVSWAEVVEPGEEAGAHMITGENGNMIGNLDLIKRYLKCCREQLNTTQLSDDQQDWTNDKSAPDTQSSETVDKEAETGVNDVDLEAAQHTEEEPKELTLDEYKALRGNRQKPTFNLRKAGEGEDLSQWKKMYALNKKKEGEEEEDEEDVRYLVEYDASDYPQRVGRQKHLLDIDIHFADTRRGTRSRGRGGPRAGGGGGSRGGGVGPTRGNITPGLRGAISGGETRQTNVVRDRDRMDRPEREPYQNRATRQSAPKVDDEHDFPSLG
uniref:Hyaluronan/mRNA-binding protein domain-containing protein n=1 Tax=Timema douglasi TaxID=61478 RepID=A0A7R8VHT2_TIMDO|nr:unnamed protein product [Timema douglasi]